MWLHAESRPSKFWVAQLALFFHMFVQHHDVHAKTTPGGGHAALGDPLGLHGLEEVLKDPVRLARLHATRPSPPWANQSEAEHNADVAGTWRSRTMANRRILQGVAEDDDDAIMHSCYQGRWLGATTPSW
jgi:hypothetical protein